MTLTDVRLPPDRFYWAVLDTASLPRSITPSRRTKQLGYLLEPMLPVPLESVHAVFTHMSATRVIACAMEHNELASISNAASLGPTSAPPFIAADVPPLNLLTARHEPQILRARRNKLAISAAAAMVLCTAIVLIGLQRRLAHVRLHTQELQDAKALVFDQVLPDSLGTQPPELRLIAERRQLERTRAARIKSASGIAPALASLLEAWPAELDIMAQSIVITDTAATITAGAPGHDDAQRLAGALDQSPQWRANNPQSTTNRDGVQLTLRLDRIASPQEAKPERGTP